MKDKEDLIDLINFSKSIKADIKIMELFPDDNREIVQIEKLESLVDDLRYDKTDESFRRKIYKKNVHKIILLKCTCSAVKNYEDRGKACYENNDIYLSMDGDLHLCRKTDDIISIIDELHSNNYVLLEKKMEIYFENLGNRCKKIQGEYR